jgi:hypothetical protein
MAGLACLGLSPRFACLAELIRALRRWVAKTMTPERRAAKAEARKMALAESKKDAELAKAIWAAGTAIA